MALVLATLALTFATIMGMVAAAVLAYFCWNGVMWLLEPNDGPVPPSMTWDVRNRPMNAWTDGSAARDLVQRADVVGRAPMCQELAWNGQMLSSHANAGVNKYEYKDFGRDWLNKQTGECAIEEEIQSPPPRARKETTPLDLSPVAVKMPNRSRVAQEVVSMEDLQKGYAAHFALWFNGDLQYHLGNLRAVTDAYALNAPDMCYCFLCLEAAAKGTLTLKKWATGVYAARIWLVSLARFVKTAQRTRGAQDEDKMEPLCQEWQYNQDHFVREVLACEVPFQREHGRTLLAAFQTEDIRRVEVRRAQQILLQHGATAPVKGQRQLALPLSSSQKDAKTKALTNEVLPSASDCVPKRRNAEVGTVALPTKRPRKW